MEFLNNSLVQFFINATIGLLTVIVAIIALFLSSKKSYPLQIFYKRVSSYLALRVKKADDIKGDVEVFFRKRQVQDDIYEVKLRLWNSGEALEPQDYDSPIEIMFGTDAKVIDANIEATDPPTHKSAIEACLTTKNDHAIVLDKPQLFRDASITLCIFVTNFNGVVTIKASARKQTNIMRNWEKTIVGRLLRSTLIRFGMIFLIFIFSLSLSLSIISTVIVELNLQKYLEIDPIAVFIFVFGFIGLPCLFTLLILIQKLIPDLFSVIITKEWVEARKRYPPWP